jgi:hypothetical protein
LNPAMARMSGQLAIQWYRALLQLERVALEQTILAYQSATLLGTGSSLGLSELSDTQQSILGGGR